MKTLDGDEAFYHRHDKDGNLDGMISSHVNDFILAGTDEFLDEITRNILEKLEILKFKDDEFSFIGMDVKSKVM